jgi:hypothetical protein
MNDRELAEEIEVRLPQTEFNGGNISLSDKLWQQIIAALRRSQPETIEPFCWYRTTRDITDEYVTVYSEDGERPKGDGWKPLYKRQPEGMVMVRGMKLADEMVDAMNQCRLSLEGSARQAEWRSVHDKARRELFAMLSATEASKGKP